MEFLTKIIEFLSDQNLNETMAMLARDYKILSVLVYMTLGGMVQWAVKKIADSTPWTSDDGLAAWLKQFFTARFGVSNETKEDNK